MPKLSLSIQSLLHQFCTYLWLHTRLPPGLFPHLVPSLFSASVFSSFTQLPQLHTTIFQNWNFKFPICAGSLCDIYVLLKHQWVGLHSVGYLPCFDNLIKEITKFEYSMGDADLLLLSHQLAVPVQVMYLQKKSYSKISQNWTLQRISPYCNSSNSLVCELRFLSYNSEICVICPNEVCSWWPNFKLFASKCKGITAS